MRQSCRTTSDARASSRRSTAEALPRLAFPHTSSPGRASHSLRERLDFGHAQGMADQSPLSELTPAAERFGAGLTEAETRSLQMILREQTGVEVSLPEAWLRAIELLSLVETLCVLDAPLRSDRPA